MTSKLGTLTGHSVKVASTGRRILGIALIGLVPVALALAVQRLGGPGAAIEETFVSVGVSLVVPLIALVASVGALRDDLRSGAIVHLVTRPVHREVVLVSRVAAAWGLTLAGSLVALSLPLAVTGGQGVEAWWASIQATVPASLAYVSLFVLLGVFVKRAALVGLVYLVAWEVVVATTPFFFRYATVGYWVRSFLSHKDAFSASFTLVSGTPASTVEALTALVFIAAAAIMAGAVWFGRMEIRGPEPDA